MKICLVKFVTMQDVYKFTQIISNLSEKSFLTHETYKIDAKSILGILSLNLDNEVTLEIENYNEDDKHNLFSKLKNEGFQIKEL